MGMIWKCMACEREYKDYNEAMQALVCSFGLGRFCPSCIDDWMRRNWGEFLLIEIEGGDDGK